MCILFFLVIYFRYEAHVLEKISKSTTDVSNYPIGTFRTSMMTYRPVSTTATTHGTLLHTNGSELPPYTFPIAKEERLAPNIPQGNNPHSLTNNVMMRSIGEESDYLAPQSTLEVGNEDDNNSVQYWILENPAENVINNKGMSDEMYQSIHLNNSLSSNKV